MSRALRLTAHRGATGGLCPGRRPALASALAATLVAVPAVVLPAPAAARSCLPPTAEHAFEELLDVAEDGSPLEDEVWRIADEQEDIGAFETPETIRRIDELGRANGFVYDCDSRMYHPFAGPDPRDAIENGHEPPDTYDDDEETAGGGGGSATGREVPRAAGPPAAPAGGGSPGGGGAVTARGSGSPEPTRSEVRHRPGGTAGGEPARAADSPDGATFVDGVPRPGDAPDGRGGVVALGEAEESRRPWPAIVIVVLAGSGALVAARVLGHRRRSPQAL